MQVFLSSPLLSSPFLSLPLYSFPLRAIFFSPLSSLVFSCSSEYKKDKSLRERQWNHAHSLIGSLYFELKSDWDWECLLWKCVLLDLSTINVVSSSHPFSFYFRETPWQYAPISHSYYLHLNITWVKQVRQCTFFFAILTNPSYSLSASPFWPLKRPDGKPITDEPDVFPSFSGLIK